MYDRFVMELRPRADETVLEVGVTSDRTYEHSNYLVAWYPHKAQLTCVGIDDAAFLESEFPGVRFVRANGLHLPFPDRSFDVVHSSAVLEHVGSRQNQTRFLSELARVSRRALFVTTPNRWFPVEFHTVLPLVHWLPQPWFRGLLRGTRLDFFASEKNLNLLTDAELQQVAAHAAIPKARTTSVGLLGWPTNLILIGESGA